VAVDGVSFVSLTDPTKFLLKEDGVPRLPVRLTAGSLILGALLSPARPALAQQGDQPLQEWTLRNVRAALCVHFLMDSAAADKKLPKEYRTVRASDFPDLSPALRNLIAGEPEYQAWVPARWCSAWFDQVQVGDQTLGKDNPGLDDTQYLGAWLIGAVPVQAPAGPPAGASWFIATMRTPNWRLIRLAETSLIQMEHAEQTIGKVPESTEDRYRVEMGRTIITWDGHLAGDSAAAGMTSEQTWHALNSRGARIRARVAMAPAQQQNIVGSLQIAGNDDLAKNLRASPIRMVGPLNWGGEGVLSFVR
jgi:hypothetical protein